MKQDDMELIAYSFSEEEEMPIRPASSDRAWMYATSNQFAKRCLPLLIANQAGWMIHNVTPFEAVWDGGLGIDAVRISSTGSKSHMAATSHFGHGIITWHIPYLFRTPDSYNLLVRGPTNSPKDGATPLDGIVETDWAVATFTMNWKLTRPGLPVQFGYGEPICMISPLERNLLNSFEPSVSHISTNPILKTHFEEWSRSRESFIRDAKRDPYLQGGKSWQKHYFNGTAPSGNKAPSHQTKLGLRPFETSSLTTINEPLDSEPVEPSPDRGADAHSSLSPLIVDSFFRKADELRAKFEQHFGSSAPMFTNVLPSWSFRFDPPEAVYLSSSINSVFGDLHAKDMIAFLSEWALEKLGLHLRGVPSVNLYLQGCFRKCSRSISGRLAYSLSLSKNSLTLITTGSLSENAEQRTQRFNELFLYPPGPTFQWTVPEGPISPLDGFVSIEGELEEQFTVAGSINRQEVFSTLAGILEELRERLSTELEVVSGFATVRFTIAKSGRVVSLNVLANTMFDNSGGLVSQALLTCVRKIVRTLVFPSSGGETQVILPLVID